MSPGFAADGRGRWLIVDEPAICCIRTLQGFGALCGEAAILWLTYRVRLARAAGECAIDTEGPW